MKRTFYFFILLLFFFRCKTEPDEVTTIYLDEIPFNEIVDPYGPPKRQVDFTGDTLEIREHEYKWGLGTHAPSTLHIDLNKKGVKFSAWVGVDEDVRKFHSPETRDELGNVASYVYDNKVDHYDFTKGGTVIFKVFLDGKLHYSSGLMNVATPPRQIDVNLNGAERLTLVADPTEDGSFADYANWAMASLTLKGESDKIRIYHYPGDILVNHAGFPSESFKTCYRHGRDPVSFSLVNEESGEIAFSGQFEPVEGDLGDYLRGDFSKFTAPGRYYITSDTMRSVIFEIRDDVYGECLKKHLTYINLQRSGHPDEGWAPANHLDDGIRQDNGEYQDVTGGWYDANDLRKPAKGNSLLLYALARVAEKGVGGISDEEMLEEIRWGNKFLFSMQEPDGHLLHYVGFTWEGYRENKWTDNIVGTEDDRTIITRPTDVNSHLAFIAAESIIAIKFRELDPDYTAKCIDAAERAWEWVKNNSDINNHEDFGLAVTAISNLFKATGNEKYRRDAEDYLSRLLSMQKEGGEVIGNHFFDLDAGGTREGGLAMMGMADFIRTFPDHPLSERAKSAMQAFAEDYYSVVEKTNAFSVIPWLLSKDTLESGKKIGPYWYKNFLHVGMNQHLSRNGAGLVVAGEILDKPEYIKTAQRQLDWIYGANPYNASTVTDIGYNQPALFKTTAGEFKPHTPELTGGVMTGIGSNHPKDDIALYPGWWWTTEYWSPTVTYTIILVNNLNDYAGNN